MSGFRFVCASALAALLAATTVHAADWHPANGPLMTRWAKDVNPDKPHPEYPRPQMHRERWLNLNGVWQLAFAQKGEPAPTGRDLSERILVPFPVESALSGVMKHGDRLWYRRLFRVPKEWDGQRVLLHFGAVDWEANVRINGKQLGSHRGGYDGFSFDITDALQKDGEQELIVGVWDPTDAGTQPRGKQIRKPEGIWYTPTTGIWQTVWLEPVPQTSIKELHILPDFDAKQVTIHARLRIDNVRAKKASDQAAPYTIFASVLDGGKVVAKAAGTPGRGVVLTLPEPKEWTPEKPFLYDVKIALYRGVGNQRQEIDSVSSYFGMRKISVGRVKGDVTRLLLNNRRYFMVGPLDQGFWPDGLYTAPTDEALKYDLEMTKKLGFNMTRKHVKVEPARWYYWCDKLGLLVWQDMPSGDKYIGGRDPDIQRSAESAKDYETELKAMIDGLRNHPSIVMWVVFNEGWGQFDTPRITEWTKKYDPSRLVNCASGWTDRGVGDVHDFHAYPGPRSPNPEAKRAAVLGEFGGLGLKVDGHTWEKRTWGYRGTTSQKDLTRKYERLLHGVYALKEKPGLSAAVYTQITDVETEANGLLTYDRAVVKVDPERVAAANRGDFSRLPEQVVVVPTAKEKGQTWRYTLKKPEADWIKPDFSDADWKEGESGFGTEGTPGAVVRTKWDNSDIWLRRTFELPEITGKDLFLVLHHDEDAEVYINGVLAAKVRGYTTDYEDVDLNPAARAALKPGKNLIAVHCRQTRGGQYIDVGISAVKDKK